MEQLKQQMDKFERRMMMADYNEKIKKAEAEGDKELADRLFQECFTKAKEMGWKIGS